MDSDEEDAAALIMYYMGRLSRPRQNKRLWTRSWLARRKEKSVYHRLQAELSLEDPEAMRQWVRLDKQQYQSLLQLVTPLIERENTRMRQAVTAGERLTLTLRHLAAGETQASLARQFRISPALISSIIPEVCRAIYQVLRATCVTLPTSAAEWQQVAADFFTQWNFPLCLGALDGRHVLLTKPPHSGSEHYDNKGHFSMIVLALVDADHKFMYVDVGTFGSASDYGVWDECSLKAAIEGNHLDIPAQHCLPHSDRQCPYVMVGSDGFPPKPYIMKPFPGRQQTPEQRIFNYHLSRATRTSENAFGIMAARFQFFKHVTNTSPSNVKPIVLAIVALHNFLMSTSKEVYAPPEFLDREDPDTGRLQKGQWQQHPHDGLQRLYPVSRRHTNMAKDIRNTLKDYFNNEGKVACQDKVAV